MTVSHAALLFALFPAAGGPYVVELSPVSGGEQRAAGGSYVLAGVVGAAVGGRSAGGSYVLDAGVAPAMNVAGGAERLFHDGFEP